MVDRLLEDCWTIYWTIVERLLHEC